MSGVNAIRRRCVETLPQPYTSMATRDHTVSGVEITPAPRTLTSSAGIVIVILSIPGNVLPPIAVHLLDHTYDNLNSLLGLHFRETEVWGLR